jgi:hypothetical protein
MALFKETTDRKGITTRYHKIGKMSIVKHTPKDEADERSHLICANVQSYASEDYRRADENNAILSRDFHIFVTLDEIAETPILTLAYDKLKALPTFDGAEDC